MQFLLVVTCLLIWDYNILPKQNYMKKVRGLYSIEYEQECHTEDGERFLCGDHSNDLVDVFLQDPCALGLFQVSAGVVKSLF